MEIKKVVLIEDDKIFSKIIFEELTDLGFEVHRAYDGEEGIELVVNKQPDLVLLDLLLPKKDGFTVLKELQHASGEVEIPVIVLTNMDGMNNIAEAMSLGAKAYFVKSHQDLDGLVEIIHDQIKTL